MSFITKLFNRRSEESIRDLNSRFLNAVPRDRENSEEFERNVLKTLEGFLDAGADIDTKDHLGWTALTRLAIWGYTIPALALVERGADTGVRSKGDTTALQGAAQNSNVELMRLILSKSANALDAEFTSGRVMGAAIGGRVNEQEDKEKKIACIEMLIERGFTIGPDDKPSAWHYPYLAPYVPGLAEAKEIEAAVEAGDIEKIKELAEKGFKPDILAEFGQDTPLFKAAKKGDAAMMAELIKLGSDLNIMCHWSNQTPLMAAAESGRMEALELLVDAGVDLVPHVRYERHSYDEPGHSDPDLYMAAREGGPEIKKRVDDLLNPASITLQRRTTIMKTLRLGKGTVNP
ncbi:MAG: ankyrin repeat domain-containing protein [Alphaproteobacteria bacterium]